jgi:hypothetical protein
MEKNKETLNALYWKENKSISEIAKIFGLNYHTIRYFMMRLGIPRRTFKEGMELKYRRDRTLFHCEVCGNEFFLTKSTAAFRVRNGGKIRYCSRKCRAIGQKGKQLKSNEKLICNANITRRLRKELGKCQLCGFNEARILTLHHKDCDNRNNDSKNLILLCPNCHSLEHLKIGYRNSMPIVYFKNKDNNFSRYRICWWCGKVFLGYRPSVPNKFCSLSCKNKWQSVHTKGENNSCWKQREIILCKQCNKPFEVLPSRNDQIFCSLRCATKYRWEINGKL